MLRSARDAKLPTSNTEVWVTRSRVSRKDRYKGVLFASWPDAMNDYLHRLTADFVSDSVPSGARSALDLGCGYGRISIELRKKFPRLGLTGLDVSPVYVAEYRRNVSRGRAMVSNCVSLPFRDGSVDLVFEVFSLMYLPDKKAYATAVSEMLRVMSGRGRAVIVESPWLGASLVNGFGLFPLLSALVRRKKLIQTKGLYFGNSEIARIVRRQGGRVLLKRGIPFFTLFIPWGNLIGRIFPRLLPPLLRLVAALDRRIRFLNFLSLYHFHVIAKGGA